MDLAGVKNSSFVSIERVLRFTVSVFAAAFAFTAGASLLTRFGDFTGLALERFRFVAFGLTMDRPSDSSAWLTKENADWRRGVIGMKNGLGQGELIWRSVDEAVERIDGTRSKTGFELDGVLGSRLIGLKKIISVLSESGDEQSLGVSDVELSRFASGLESADVDVVGVLDPELLFAAILDRKVMPLLKAVLKMLLYLAEPDASLLLVDALLDDAASLKDSRKSN